jgi:hypothetical protein
MMRIFSHGSPDESPKKAVIPAKAGIQYAVDSRLKHCGLWSTGSSAGACRPAGQRPDRMADDDSRGGLPDFASLAMTSRCKSAISLQALREVWPARSTLSHQRVQGMPGARCARKPRVQK